MGPGGSVCVVLDADRNAEQPAALQACTAYCRRFMPVGDGINALVVDVVATMVVTP